MKLLNNAFVPRGNLILLGLYLLVIGAKATHIIHCLIRLILAERFPLLYMGAFLDVPLDDLNFRDP